MARTVWLPLIARVIWRSESTRHSQPTALVVAGERFRVEVERRWTEGPAEAGAAVWSVFLLRDSLGRRMRVRVDHEGRERVEVEEHLERG